MGMLFLNNSVQNNLLFRTKALASFGDGEQAF